MYCRSLILFFILLFPFLGLTQKRIYEKGLTFYEAKQYQNALEYFYADKTANFNKELLIRRIICNYQTGKIDKAKEDVSRILSLDDYPPETFFVIGQIYQSEANFDKAVENYKIYLRQVPKAINREEVIKSIKQCGKAKRLFYKEAEAFVDNYGSPINTEFDEFRMIQSPNYDNKFYFSSAREGSNGGRRDLKGKRDEVFGFYNSDMYTIENENGDWLPIRAINPFINSSRDELALDFSSDGSILFYMKGESYEKGVIYTDTFSVDRTEKLNPKPLVTPINASIGDTWIYLFNDKTILFASNRPGGFGGYDLYVTFSQDGSWSVPKNLGPSVNSKFDEVSPCISTDGKLLYFSSNRLESFGGFDVFKAAFNETSKLFEAPTNLGRPINSAGNDLALYINKDGNTATLTSDRKDGFGGYDLYRVYFKDQIKEQLNTSASLAFISDEEFVAFNKPRISVPISKTKNVSKEKPKKESNNKVAKVTETPVKTLPAKSEQKKQRTKKSKVKKQKKEKNTAITKTTKKEPSIKQYILNPVFYSKNQEIINAESEKELTQVLNILNEHPQSILYIKSHINEDGMEAVDLYFAIKRAEQVATYLVEKGINGNRIHLKSYGSNYPIAKPESGGQPNKVAEKVNSRIEFEFKNANNQPLKVEMKQPYLTEYLRDPRGEIFKTIEDGLSYRVQVASVGQMYQNQILLVYNDGMIERPYNGSMYKYTLGLYETYEDAEKLINDLKNYNVTEAFIVPYINGRRLNKNEFDSYTNQYENLLKFTQNKQ